MEVMEQRPREATAGGTPTRLSPGESEVSCRSEGFLPACSVGSHGDSSRGPWQKLFLCVCACVNYKK